jgi:tetratricopeptide (TPR) repeat protein
MSSISAIGRMVALATILGAAARAQTPAAAPRTATLSESSGIVLQQKPDFVLWDANRKIEPGVVGLVYRVEKTQRLNLLLSDRSRGLRGWAPSSAVIELNLAEEFFTRSIAGKPDDPFAYTMRGIARSVKGDASGAIADFGEALKRDPNYVPALVHRARLLKSRDKVEQAQADLDRAVAHDGRDASALVARGVFRFNRKDNKGAWEDLNHAAEMGAPDIIVPILRGQILLQKNDTKQAYDAFLAAQRIDPSRHDVYLGLASVYLMRGQPKNAQVILDDAVRADPNSPEAYGNRATFYLARNDYEQALFNLDEVIRLSPGSAHALNERAWLLTTCRDEKLRDAPKAVKSATKACELSGWKNPRYLATLAAANSEVGDFESAVHNQERALALLAEKAPEKTEYRRLVDRYRSNKPHHSMGLLEELGVKKDRPAGRPAS